MDVLIGSQALAKYIDLSANDEDYFSDTRSKSFNVDVFYDDRLEAWEPWRDAKVATLDELYTIKLSHQFWDLHGTWWKHLGMLGLMQQHGAQPIPELFGILYPIWEDLHGAKPAHLQEDGFFGPQVNRVYEHDDLHTIMAYGDKPLYEKILKDNHRVVVQKSKFDTLTDEEKLNLVREEVEVIALERWLIPEDMHGSYSRAYRDAYKHLVTSLTKGWFALFALENHQTLSKPNRNYKEVFQQRMNRLQRIH